MEIIKQEMVAESQTGTRQRLIFSKRYSRSKRKELRAGYLNAQKLNSEKLFKILGEEISKEVSRSILRELYTEE